MTDSVTAKEYRSGKVKARGRARIQHQRTERHGIVFDSKREADRYDELLLLERAGEISGLERQVRYALVVGHTLVCEYVSDFDYLRDGRHVCEDVKGHRTETYRLKKKLMYACHGIRILET